MQIKQDRSNLSNWLTREVFLLAWVPDSVNGFNRKKFHSRYPLEYVSELRILLPHCKVLVFFRYSLSCSFQAIWFSARSKFWSDLKLLMVIPVPLLSAVLDGFNVFYCRFIHRWNHSVNVAGWLVMIQCCNGSERRTHPETLNGSIVSKTRRTTWHMTQRFFMAGPLFFRILGIFFRPYSHGSWQGGKSLTSLGVETPAVA